MLCSSGSAYFGGKVCNIKIRSLLPSPINQRTFHFVGSLCKRRGDSKSTVYFEDGILPIPRIIGEFY